MSRRAEAVRVAAVDLGASSGRVVVGARNGPRVSALREVHRFPNQPRTAGGVLRWDARALFAGILDGLRAAAADGRARSTRWPSTAGASTTGCSTATAS